MKKQVTVNSQKIKVEFDLVRGKFLRLESTKTQFNRGTCQVSLIVDSIEYKDCFTLYTKCATNTGNLSVSFTCNKTGKVFSDSHVKLIEHILNSK